MNQIGDDGAARRGHDADPPRKSRQRALSRGIKQSFGRQFLLQLLEGQLQRAQTLRFENFDNQLVFAARFIDIQTPAREHGEAVLRFDLPVAMRGAEGDAPHLGLALLQGEIIMAAGGEFDAGDLARDPQILEFRIQNRADCRIQLGDCKDTPFRRAVELEGELLHRAMVIRGADAKVRTGPHKPVRGRRRPPSAAIGR